MDEGISKLPEPILQHILSFLSQKEAVRTCVLSKSWRHLSLGFRKSSKSLEEIHLEVCNSGKINSIVNNHLLKTLILRQVYIEEETFAKIMSSCPLIERLVLRYCKGLRTINMHNHHNLKSFELYNNDEAYLPSIVGYKYFPALTCLKLIKVPLSNEWLNSFSHNFPCLEELQLLFCFGFDELKLSGCSIKYLEIRMDESTTKATIDAPSIEKFRYSANISQSISFTSTTSSEWNSQIHLSLDSYASLWLLKLSEFVAAFSQSRISSLVLYHSGSENQLIEHLSDICCGSYKPVALKRLNLILDAGLYYDSFFSDLMNGLFRIIRPREIHQQRWLNNARVGFTRKRNEVSEFLCRTLQSEDEGTRSFWQQDLEEVSLEVHSGDFEEWHPVQTTMSWSEYVATLLPLRNISFCEIRFLLKWRENLDNPFDYRDFVLNLLISFSGVAFCAAMTLLSIWYFWSCFICF